MIQALGRIALVGAVLTGAAAGTARAHVGSTEDVSAGGYEKLPVPVPTEEVPTTEICVDSPRVS
jgi:uncharacterized protein YcnI